MKKIGHALYEGSYNPGVQLSAEDEIDYGMDSEMGDPEVEMGLMWDSCLDDLVAEKSEEDEELDFMDSEMDLTRIFK